jgi:hypothetical protein
LKVIQYLAGKNLEESMQKMIANYRKRIPVRKIKESNNIF